MLAVAGAASRRWRPGLLQFWAALVLGTLLAGCGDSAAPPPSPREDTAVQQPVLRPRAAKLTATVTSAPPLAPSLATASPAPTQAKTLAATVTPAVEPRGQPATPVATAAPVRETTPGSRQKSATVVAERSETVREGTPEPSIFTSVSTGKDHTCALLPDGEAYCWGPNNDDGHLDIPSDTRFLRISAGHRFTCGIRVDHGITCWGNNNHKKLEAPEGRFTALDTGWDHACALGANGAVCWGWNANERAAPPPDFAFTAIAAGAEHSCGLTINGDLRCWGKNDNGRADFQEGPFQALSVGTSHTCALRADGRAFCQGENAQKQSGVPKTVFEAISAGDDHTCGTRPDGTLECWGGAGQISNILLTAPNGIYSSVSAGFRHTCALNAEGQAACWNHPYIAIATPPYDNLNFANAVPDYALQKPVEAFPWPGGGLLIADLDGEIAVYGSESKPIQILDIADKISSMGSERGLLGAAVDPEFERFPFLYVYYTARSEREGVEPGARLSRFPVVDGRAVREDELVMLEHPGLYDFHQGGSPRFGPDGMLYLGIGDGTCSECSRYLDTLLGKIIRIDVRDATPERPYRIPPDNPLINDLEAKHEIWAYGLRNPWRMSFDSPAGQLWVADVGAGFEEEVSIVRGGADMGWPVWEGRYCRRDLPGGCDVIEGTTPPIAAYNHSHGCAIIGGGVYRGAAIPKLEGAYVFGDLCSGRIWALVSDGSDDRTMVEIANLDVPVVSFGVDADGEALVLAFGGLVLRLVEAETGLSAPDKVVPAVTTPPAGGT